MTNYRFVSLKWCVLLTTTMCISGCIPGLSKEEVRYLVSLNADGSRVVVGKAVRLPKWELYEGVVGQALQRVAVPEGLYSTGTFVYAPDGKGLYFAATASSQAGVVAYGTNKEDAERITTTESLWLQKMSNQGTTPAVKIFEDAMISNPLPLLDGSIAYMGAVKRVKSIGWSPLHAGDRVWTNYSWKLRKPDNSITVLNPRHYAFYSRASLIRDEAVFFIQERWVNGKPMEPPEYFVDVTPIKPGVDLPELTKLGAKQDGRGEPSLQCDWAGKTCIRKMAYTKNRYLAHQLEIIRDGKACKVEGLPDRIEKADMARDGNSLALMTRPNPYTDKGYQLAHLPIGADGCAGGKNYFTLP